MENGGVDPFILNLDIKYFTENTRGPPRPFTVIAYIIHLVSVWFGCRAASDAQVCRNLPVQAEQYRRVFTAFCLHKMLATTTHLWRLLISLANAT